MIIHMGPRPYVETEEEALSDGMRLCLKVWPAGG